MLLRSNQVCKACCTTREGQPYPHVYMGPALHTCPIVQVWRG